MKKLTATTRRTFLRLVQTAAGAAVLAPFLSEVARAQTTTPPPRFVFFVEGNGYEPVTVLSPSTRAAIDATLAAPIGSARFWPRRYRHASVLETSGDLAQAPSLQDLGALAQKTAVLLGLSSKITGGGHSALHGVLSSRRSNGSRPTGETIDAHLSKLPGLAGSVFDAVRVGYCSHQHHPGKNLDFGTCALDDGVAAPVVLQPQSAYDMLFGAVSNPAQFERDGSVLDFAREDVARTLAAFSSSSPERQKLENYLAAIETNITRRARLQAALPGLPPLPARPTATRTPEDFFAVLQAQTDVVAVALQGGLTRVSVVAIGTGADFDTFYDASHTGRHTACHESERDNAQRDYLHENGRRQLALMIDLARRLDEVPEGAGTLLDHTVLVYVGDNGETHHAEADEFPVVVMGGGAKGLRTGGRSLVYPGQDRHGAGHRQVSNLWNTLGVVAGEDLVDFGGESLRSGTRSAEGPLSELLG